MIDEATPTALALRAKLSPEVLSEDDYFILVQVASALDDAAALIHKLNAKWWRDLETDKPKARNMGEMLMLVVTELAEGMEGHRKSKSDDHLPHFPMLTVELADAMIRELDICGGTSLAIGQAFFEKTLYNFSRQDHTREARRAQGGKKV